MAIAYLIVGGNLGDREQNIAKSLTEIRHRAGNIRQSSSLFETEPWGFSHENYFLNQVLEIETLLSPHQLLRTVQNIEQLLGRKRNDTTVYQARTIDIDILFYDDLIIMDKKLSIPHPELQNRKFVLEPLKEICPELIHPALNISVNTLHDHCSDQKEVKIKITAAT